jgi:hypothetical protein
MCKSKAGSRNLPIWDFRLRIADSQGKAHSAEGMGGICVEGALS